MKVEFQAQRKKCMEYLKEFMGLLSPYNDSLVVGYGSLAGGYGRSLRKQTRKVTWLLKTREVQHAETILQGHLRNVNIYQSALSQYA